MDKELLLDFFNFMGWSPENIPEVNRFCVNLEDFANFAGALGDSIRKRRWAATKLKLISSASWENTAEKSRGSVLFFMVTDILNPIDTEIETASILKEIIKNHDNFKVRFMSEKDVHFMPFFGMGGL